MSKHVYFLRSSQLNDTSNGPKLPTPEQFSDYGEIAINYAEGYETISTKNSNNQVVTFSSDTVNEDKFALKSEISDVDTSITNIETSVTVIQGDINNINTAITEIQGDITNIEGNVASNTEAINKINQELGFVDGEFTPQNTIIATANNMTEAIEILAGRIENVKVDIFRVVTTLPTQDIEEDVVYLVPATTTGEQNTYIEYTYVNNAWEKLGEVSSTVDLSDYYTKDEANSIFAQSSAVTNLSTSVSELETVVSGLSTTLTGTLQNDISQLKSDTATLESDITALTSQHESDIAEIKAYTVNSKAINTNPVLNGADIQLTGWDESTGTNEQLFLTETDTVNVALGKIQKMIGDNEEITSKALNVLNGSCGFNQNGIYEPDNSYLNGETNLASAIDKLAETVNFLNGHNSLDSTQSIPSTKRLVIVTRSSNDVLTLASNNLPDGRELHIIVHNTGSGDITISMPTSGGFVNVVGDTLTVSAGSYGEINVISDGVNKYIRFA